MLIQNYAYFKNYKNLGIKQSNNYQYTKNWIEYVVIDLIQHLKA